MKMIYGLGLVASLAFGMAWSCQASSQEPPKIRPVRHEVADALDDWSNRARARDAVLPLGQEGLLALASIATADEEEFVRRKRAIALLGTFPGSISLQALTALLNDGKPSLRCSAIHALMELGECSSVRDLINKLDDRSVCMHLVQTDPPKKFEVFVSDEAVRALRQLTGLSFGGDSDLWVAGHRATSPWKRWWGKHCKRWNQGAWPTCKH